MVNETVRQSSAKLRLPDRVEGHGLLVGWSSREVGARKLVGFNFGDPALTPATGYADPIVMDGEGHLLTIAPTGAGKGTGCIVPALLRHDGPVIVIDPKGENAAITARRRREMGQRVVVIDPIGVSGLASDTLNPLDLIDPDSPTATDQAMALVETLTPPKLGNGTTDGDYWRERGSTFVLGVMLHVLSDLPQGERHLGNVQRLVAKAAGEAAVYQMIAEGKEGQGALAGTVLGALESSRHPEARNIGNVLRVGAISTLGGILSMAQSMVSLVRAGSVEASLRTSSFDLDAVTRAEPLSIYLVLPPHMLGSHGRLLRLWVQTLMSLISRRRTRPQRPTLFILDEAAQLGTFDPLRSAVTLMRGYGLKTWSFWQDPSQLVNLYPLDWQTMLNNCRAIQCFGPNTMVAASEMARLVGYANPGAFLDMEDGDMLLQISGDTAIVARLPDYRADPPFHGLADPNPFHDPKTPIAPPSPPALPEPSLTSSSLLKRLRSKP